MIIEATPSSEPLRKKVEAVWARLEQLTVGAMTREQQTESLQVLERLESNLVEPR